MDPKTRVLNCIKRTGPDRLPIKHHFSEGIDEEICRIYGITDQEEFLSFLGDDFRYVQPERLKPGDSAECFDYTVIPSQIDKAGSVAIVTGYSNHLSCINEVAERRLGFEQTMVDIAFEDPDYLEIVRSMTDFYYDHFRSILDQSSGRIDIVHIGDDFGGQEGLLISPGSFRKLFKPGIKRIADLAHSCGAYLMLHSCGSVRGLIPDLIDAGVDILDVVQVSAKGMDIEGLAEDFGNSICFCGSMDVQSLLLNASADEIRHEVVRRRELFIDGGLILGPCHSIMPGTPIENVIEMYRAAGSLDPEISQRRKLL